MLSHQVDRVLHAGVGSRGGEPQGDSDGSWIGRGIREPGTARELVDGVR